MWQNKQKFGYGRSCIVDAVNFPGSFAYHPSAHDSSWGQHPTPSPESLHPGRETDEKTNNAVTGEGWGPRRPGSQFEVLWGGEDQAEHQTVSLEEEE